jgi:hypothetical protein
VPAYDSGDHLHLDADGSRVVGLVVRRALGLGSSSSA